MESRLDRILSEKGFIRRSEFAGLLQNIEIECCKGHLFSVLASSILKDVNCKECVSEPEIVEEVKDFEIVKLDDEEESSSIIKIYPSKKDSPSLVAYCRVSSEMQRNNYSIATQEDSAIRFASENGYSLLRIYEDIAISGKTVNTRKALQTLLNDLEPGTTVFFYSITRMSRNVRDVNDIVDKITSKKCTFVSLDLPRECSGPSANLFLNILATMSQFERETTSKRVSDVMKNLSSKGELRSKPPFGYKFVGKGKPFEKDEEEQKIIELLRCIKEQNPEYTPTQICRLLDSKNIKTRKCKRNYPNRIKEIMLQNNII